jgi:hypothetical protein
LNPPYIPTAEAMGTPVQEFVLTSSVISPPGVPSEEVFGVPVQSFVVDQPLEIIYGYLDPLR